jgi:hypothetical protein
VAWKNFYQRYMRLINDYKNMGGRVTVGTDAPSGGPVQLDAR